MTVALILAGGKLAPELVPFADGAPNRALIRVGPNGETMLDLVVSAVRHGLDLSGERQGRILVAGEVPLPNGCQSVSGGDSLVETIMNGLNAVASNETRLLIVTADAPFLTREAVADFLQRAEAVQPTPFAYPIIEAERCRAAFPGMKRTTLRIAEGEFTGGNLALLDPQFLRGNEQVIRDAYARRRDKFALAKLLGGEIILRFLLSRLMPSMLKIKDLEKAVGRVIRSDLPRAIITPYSEIGADVDYPEHIALAREILVNRPNLHAPI